MKINKNPVHLIQIFDNSYKYDKNHKSFSDRKEVVKWKNAILSNSFKIENDQVFFEKNLIQSQNKILENCVIFIDYNIESVDDYLRYLKLNGLVQPSEFINFNFKNYINNRDKVEFLKIGKQSSLWHILEFTKYEEIEIALAWDYSNVGAPRRKKFKLAELKKNKPIEISIDGIYGGYAKRIFVENNLIIEYLGEYNDVFEKSDLEFHEKLIPKERKKINLLKHLK